MADDLLLLSPTQIEAAAKVGRLSRLAERLVQERSWSSAELLLSHSTLEVIPLDEWISAARAVDRALARLPEAHSRKANVVREMAALRALAGRSLAKRLRHEPLTHQERPALALAAELLLAAGEPKEAAALFERAGEDGRAADAHGVSGDLEKMEACHERMEAYRGAKRAATQLTRKVETLIESGDRVAAAMLMDGATPALLSAAGLQNVREDLQRRLCRGRALTLQLRGPQANVVRFSGVPAVLGREPGSEVPLRDPGVSRRHAVIVSDGAQLAIEDAASRAGTTVGNAVLVGRVPLHSPVEVGLGKSCRLSLQPVPENPLGTVVRVQGLTGLDRTLVIFVSAGPLDLALAFPMLAGLWLSLEGGVARLVRLASQPVRVMGQLVGQTCDLMVGDVIEVPAQESKETVAIEVLG